MIGSATTRDGATIGYREIGHGPGIVVLHGAMSSGYNHMQLGEALADAFTVYLVDRRGRGLSGPYGAGYDIQQEVDDLDAVLAGTGSHFVFGVSSGAIVALQAALSLPTILKVAIYEPPLRIKDPDKNLAHFDEEMARGNEAAALALAMKAARMGPRAFSVMPLWLLERLTKMMMTGEEKKPTGEYVTMRMLAPTLHNDSQLIVEMSGKMETFRDVRSEVLLLGGSKSPAYLKAGVDDLERVLPNSQRVEFPGLGHAASWNSDRGGHPGPVAEALRHFFAQ